MVRSKKYKASYNSNKGKIKIRILPSSAALSVLLMAVLLVEATFMLMLTMLDVLPDKFAAIIFVMLVGITVLITKLLNDRKPASKQRRIGEVISVLMIALLCLGSYYIYSTFSMFNNISDEDKQTEEFYVIALKDGSYEKLKDIKGKAVHVTKNESKSYREAKDKLTVKADVTYVPDESYIETGYILIDKDKKTYDEIIFVSSTNYEMLCEDIDGFKRKTKVIYTVSVEIEKNDIAKRIDVTNDSFNVYISGIDAFGGINKVSRSDVNMIMTVDPVEKKILLTSIPRDMYVDLHSYGAKDKLTHSGIYGVGETVETVEDWLDIDINYYIRVNFTSLKDIVDAIGGVDVESPYAFESSVSRYSYNEGINHLDGEAALFFARERKSFEDGDQERIKNQQRVLKGILDKITGSTAILTGYTQILNTIGDEIQTNLSESDISALVKMQLEDIGGWTIKTTAIKGTGTYASTYSMGSRQLYVVIPDESSVKDAQTKINEMTGK